MARGPRQIQVSQLEAFYYGSSGHPFMGMDALQDMEKTAAPILRSTSGYFNAIYGAKAWAQINAEAHGWTVVPKGDWSRTGIRLIEDLESSYEDLAMAESDTLADSVKPAIKTVTPQPKIQHKTVELSDVMQALTDLGADDVFGSMEQLRHFRAVDFARGLNKQLFDDIEARADGAGATYVETEMLRSFDSIISNDVEEDNYGGTYTGWYDYYDVDRDAATVYGDCVVAQDASSDQELDDKLLRETIADAKKAGAHTSVLTTNWDTYAQLQGIYMTYIRYHSWGEGAVETGINGIKTANGIDAGNKVAMVLGVPLIMSQDVTVDGVGRIYGLDISDPEGLGEPRLGVSLLRPVEYFESRDPILLDQFMTKGAYRVVGETYCRFFPGQFKIRDLQA